MPRTNKMRPTLELKELMQKLCSPFFSQHGFNYFQYMRCHRDGYYSLLTNETGLMEHCSRLVSLKSDPFIFSSYTSEHEKLHTYWFHWDEELPAHSVTIAREKCNFHHGVTLIRRLKDYYDMIAVALPDYKRNVTSFYLTKYKIIEEFINFFDQNHYDLIRYVNKNRSPVPSSYRDSKYDALPLPNGRLEITGRNGAFYITSQELACLRLLGQGANAKETSQILHISDRTVETYLSRVKNRSGVSSKTDLSELICTF